MENCGFTSVSGVRSGKPHDLEKQRLAKIIDRIERDETVMALVRNHSEGQVMHGLFPMKVTDAVLASMSDHDKLSISLLEGEKTGRQFAQLS